VRRAKVGSRTLTAGATLMVGASQASGSSGPFSVTVVHN